MIILSGFYCIFVCSPVIPIFFDATVNLLYFLDGTILQEGTWLSSTMVKYGAFSYLAEDIVKTDRDLKQVVQIVLFVWNK